MESFNLKKTKKYNDKSYINVNYEGRITELSNIPLTENLIEKFLSEGLSHSDMIRNVTYLRTLLDTFIEESLTIEYIDYFGNIYEFVQYENKKLFYYKCKKCFENIEIKSSFIFGQLEIKVYDKSCNFIERTNIEKTKKLSNKVLEQIANLNNIKGIILDNEEQALIIAYRLFYKENPNFNRKDINLKLQQMVIILKQFDIFSEYQFSIQNDMIECNHITEIVNKLYPLGEINVVKKTIKFKETLKVIIIGDTIREKVGNDNDLDEILLSISKTIFANNFVFPLLSDIDLVKYSDYYSSYNEIVDNIKLVKKIQERINSIKNKEI